MVVIRKLEVYKPTIFKAEQSYYDKDAADMAVNFINCLKHTKGTRPRWSFPPSVNFINCLKHTKGEWFGKNFDWFDW